MLSPEDKKRALGFSRKVLERSAQDKALRNSADWARELEAEAGVRSDFSCGLFVTLVKTGKLRGCMGSVSPEPFGRAVAQMTMQAAFSDSRFSPVSAEEVPVVRIEISVLSPLTRAANADDIIPGRHGVCASKAGMDPLAWKDPQTALEVFTVDIFEEEHLQ